VPLISRPAAGQIVSSAWGTLVADAVVMRFTTAAQRASQLTAPVVGQLTELDNRPGVLQYWSGSAWVDTAPFVQMAQTLVTTDAGGHGGITFPTPFATATYWGGTAIGPASVPTPFAFMIETLSATSVVFRTYNNNAPYVSSSINVAWLASGTRPAPA